MLQPYLGNFDNVVGHFFLGCLASKVGSTAAFVAEFTITKSYLNKMAQIFSKIPPTLAQTLGAPIISSVILQQKAITKPATGKILPAVLVAALKNKRGKTLTHGVFLSSFLYLHSHFNWDMFQAVFKYIWLK